MLDLRFSPRAGRIELSCDDDHVPDLHLLRNQFTTAMPVGPSSFDVAADEFLVSLEALLVWPEQDPAFWRWEEGVLDLVNGNAEDAAILEERLHGTGDQSLRDIPDGWPEVLTDFQQRDLGMLLQLRHGANFSVPGAGKTRVALADFAARRASGEVSRALVVCPKSAFESWQAEAAECPEDIRVDVFADVGPIGTDVLLVNYERLPAAEAQLSAWLRAAPALLVLDEAHRTKLGSLGAWGSASLALAPFASRRLILTGTPAPNGAQDLENLFGFVWPGQGRLSVSRALAAADLREASARLKPLFVRTTKNELGLPPVDVRIRYLPMPPLHRELYDALLGQAAAYHARSQQDLTVLGRVVLYLLMAATTPALLAWGASRHEPLPYRIPPLEAPSGSTLHELLRDLPHYELAPKYQEVAKIVAENASVGRKTIVWSTFVRNLTTLAHMLERHEPAVIHGGTEERDHQLLRFRRDASCAVLLTNPATLGEGVSLHHECHDAVYLDRDFAAGRYLQSVDRIHRLGLAPNTETRVTVLLSENTIDELVAQRLQLKLDFVGRILDDPAVLELGDLEEEPSVSVGMDQADVAALIGHLRSGAAG